MSNSSDDFEVFDDATVDYSRSGVSDDGSSFDIADDELSELTGRVGEYEIQRVLGAGGMGKVYLAEHVRMGRPVALKVLPHNRMGDEIAISRFYSEVRAASRLLHPNIVAAFDAGEDDGIHYLAMEYIAGETLTEIVAKSGPLSIGVAASVIRQAGIGLLQAHRAGIVHRDVKPGNLMRSADGTIKLLDLGLAQISNLQAATALQAVETAAKSETISSEESGPDVASANTRKTGQPKRSAGRLVGTLPFMSPEQLEDPDSADSRSDIYSLGATLYFLLTGEPPYTGQLIDLVYGHRHGEIPDLMQIRDDVDLNFANIFRRMMAKSPGERYTSVDEVIDELEPYADKSSAPKWLAEFAGLQPTEFDSTASGGSTLNQPTSVVGIDLGMFYAAASLAHPDGTVVTSNAGGEGQTMLRMAVANDGNQICYGRNAIDLRTDHPEQVAHCLSMYIGRDFVERRICDSPNPPEVLLAMMLKRIVQNSWSFEGAPAAVAISIPATYDQYHRRSILQAARIAGLQSVRLVDRTVSVAEAVHLRPEQDVDADEVVLANVAPTRTTLVVCLSGLGVDVSLVRREDGRSKQLSSAGHWNGGTLSWQTKLVELAVENFGRLFKLDPRKKPTIAAQLQVACERAMNSLLLLPLVNVSLNLNGKIASVPVKREDWMQRCQGLIDQTRDAITQACERAGIAPSEIDDAVTFGPLLKVSMIRDQILDGFCDPERIDFVDRLEAARGVAACVAGELPGRVKPTKPPAGVTSQSIGIVIEDAKGRRRILPIIPRGTSLPARTNRKLTVGKNHQEMKLSLVESTGPTGEEWQSLGRYQFEVSEKDAKVQNRTRMMSFQIDTNGVLTVRAQTPGSSGSTRLKTLPTPNIDDTTEQDWTSWVRAIQ